MVLANKLTNNFVAGELSPRMYARTDLPEYGKGLARCQNFITLIQGGLQFRPGNIHVAQSRLNQDAYLIPFQFSDQQSYLIEATPLVFRFYANGGLLFNGSAIIQQISPSNGGAIFQSTAHGFVVTQKITLTGIQGGMSILNDQQYLVGTVVDANHFKLTSLTGGNITAKGLGYYTGGGVANTVKVITGVTNANPGVFTSATHGLTAGQEIQIFGISGMTQLNGIFFLVSATGLTTNTFTLTDLQGNAVNTTTYGAYVSGGIFSVVYELTTPYTADELPQLQYAQDSNTMYLSVQTEEPLKLIRTSAASFTINTYTRTPTDPFNSSTRYPRAVAFINGSRLAYGDTIQNPETIFASDAPSTTNTAYEKYTSGSAATNSVQFTLAPLAGKSDAIQWIANTNQFAVVGCFGSLRTLYGASQSNPISPLGVTSLPINQRGCAQVLPVSTGESLIYVERGSRIVRSIQYNFRVNGYDTENLTLAAEHLTVSGVAQMVWQSGVPDVIWCNRGDGVIIGNTFNQKERISGWHQHKLGGQIINANNILQNGAKVISMGVMPRANNTDQLWMVVQRQIGANVITSVEYMSDIPTYPVIEDFLGTQADEQTDLRKFYNSVFETQKYACHLDMANLYDGSSQGNFALTPSAVTGTGITVTASAAFFTAAMVGRELWKQYDLNGNGGGRATITGFTDSTHVTCDVISGFDNTNQWGVGAWLLTAITVSGLNYAEGTVLNVVTDGGEHPDCTVTSGSITLQANSSVVLVGYKYTGIVETLNLDVGGVTGPAEAKPRRLEKVAVRYLNTAAGKIGTSFYHLEPLFLRMPNTPLGRPTPAQTGVKIINVFDRSSNEYAPENHLFFVHDKPMPCCIPAMDQFFTTVDAQTP